MHRMGPGIMARWCNDVLSNGYELSTRYMWILEIRHCAALDCDQLTEPYRFLFVLGPPCPEGSACVEATSDFSLQVSLVVLVP